MPNPVCEWTEELYWAKSPDLVIAPHAPVPLVSSHGSMSNQFAIQALERAQRRYVITFSADDLNLRMAAVLAGVGVIVGSSRAFPREWNWYTMRRCPNSTQLWWVFMCAKASTSAAPNRSSRYSNPLCDPTRLEVANRCSRKLPHIRSVERWVIKSFNPA